MFSCINRKLIKQELKKISYLFKSYKTLNYKTINNEKIKTTFNDNNFEISYNGLNHKKYPYIWLRDNCNCKECYDYKNQQTLINLKNASLDIAPLNINENNNKNGFTIIWSDGHTSTYDIGKLSEFVFETVKKTKTENKRFLWNYDSIKDKLNEIKFNYNDYMNNDEFFKKSLKSLVKYGLMIIKNVPNSIEDSKNAIERLCFIQKTLYGEITILTANGNREDSAYSNVALKAHNDCTYLKNAPGLEIFQLIKHDGNGGNTLLVDGFYCAQKLKELYPNDFEALTRINIKAVFKEKNKYMMSHIDPVVKLNPIDGSLLQIRYNPYDRLVPNYLSYDDTKKYYEGIKKLAEIIENNKNELWLRLQNGELLFIDNFRLMHGRSEFTGERHLLTAYGPRDDWLSKAALFDII